MNIVPAPVPHVPRSLFLQSLSFTLGSTTHFRKVLFRLGPHPERRGSGYQPELPRDDLVTRLDRGVASISPMPTVLLDPG